MASKNNINSVFTDIANSIRAKKGTTNPIQPINMAEEIDGIPTGITPSGKIEITNTEEINVTNYATAQVVDSNLIVENIKEGVSILGKVGTFKGGSSEDRFKKFLDATKSAYYLFFSYRGTSVDNLISYSDTENVTNMERMFSNCRDLQTIPQLDTSKVTNISNMLNYCQRLVRIPQLDTSNVTSMGAMFYSCSSLATIPQLNTSKVTSMNDMFYGCSALQSIPQLDTSKVTRMDYMFTGCQTLQTIPLLNTSKVTNTNGMFSGCSALTNLTLLNIKVNLQIGSGTSWGHLLTLDSLINTVMELWNYSDGSKSPKLTMGSANLEKIANTYVLVTDETTDKMTAEVCDSTTEGAITLEAFANKKGWTLA